MKTVGGDRVSWETARRWSTVPGWVLLAATAVLGVGVAELSTGVSLVPLALSAVILGLPHGATDHLVFARTCEDTGGLRSTVWVVGMYAVVGGLYLAAWSHWPFGCFVFFIALTLVHWGQGDVHTLVTFHANGHLESRGSRILAGFVRGGLPMLLPLVAFPDEVRRVAMWLTSSFGGDVSRFESFFGFEARLAVGVVVGVSVVAHLFAGLSGGWTRSWVVDAFETLLLTVFFATVEPLFAIGIYFCVWHSLRHIVRLTMQDEESREAWRLGKTGQVVWRFAMEAAPLTVAALVLFGALAAFVPHTPDSVGTWAGLYLVFISVLTLPHVCLVFWMDYVEGVWR